MRMDVLLLGLALGLYSVGLAHSVLSVLKKKLIIFKPALVAVSAGFCLHVASMLMRAYEVRYFPNGFSFFAAVAVLSFMAAYWKYRIGSLSVLAFPVIFIMTFIAYLSYDPSDSIPETLRSHWSYIHIPLVILGYAALFISFAAAVMYLLQERQLKSKHLSSFFSRIPSLEICDDMAYRSLAVGFPLMTLGIISGALWAQIEWKQGWIGDVKVQLSFVTWIIYLALIHYRLIGGWRGKKAAYLAIAGFVGVMVTFLGSSYFSAQHNFSPLFNP